MQTATKTVPIFEYAPDSYLLEASDLSVIELTPADEAEVLSYLSERITYTFGMVGFIRSNGLVSPHNRGTFYACRTADGQLHGVALIGHATMFEASSDAAIAAFAHKAKQCRDLHLLLGAQDDVQTFWNYYSDGGQRPRRYCTELLFEKAWPVDVLDSVPDLRLATLDDLDAIVPVHAQSAFEESGINPLDVDPEGFRARCARRIEKGKTWVWIDNGRVIFKAEVITDSPEVAYLEGIAVDPDERGKGIGQRCFTQLSRTLLASSQSIVLLVNQNNASAQDFYRKGGCKLIDTFDTIFLKQDVH